MPGGYRSAGGSILRSRGVAAQPVQRRSQPSAQPRRRPAGAHVHREVEQAWRGVDIAVMTQQLVHVDMYAIACWCLRRVLLADAQASTGVSDWPGGLAQGAQRLLRVYREHLPLPDGGSDLR
jgi:hypothetical protein